jgi:hypothetical protein
VCVCVGGGGGGGGWLDSAAGLVAPFYCRVILHRPICGTSE